MDQNGTWQSLERRHRRKRFIRQERRTIQIAFIIFTRTMGFATLADVLLSSSNESRRVLELSKALRFAPFCLLNKQTRSVDAIIKGIFKLKTRGALKHDRQFLHFAILSPLVERKSNTFIPWKYRKITFFQSNPT